MIQDVQSNQQVAEFCGSGSHGTHQTAPVGDDPADAFDAVVGAEARKDMPVAADIVTGGSVFQGNGGFQDLDRYAFDTLSMRM